ncbi:AAEL008082-PA [Aedes aegypti]|uniref:AAEL008082-PA n=1 Tax=Aedes aegypti TaxID=7159 RepID=Q16ZR6_AEDAE|nr:AAEL008082-PA [Aedes aegypti]
MDYVPSRRRRAFSCSWELLENEKAPNVFKVGAAVCRLRARKFNSATVKKPAKQARKR